MRKTQRDSERVFALTGYKIRDEGIRALKAMNGVEIIRIPLKVELSKKDQRGRMGGVEFFHHLTPVHSFTCL